MNKRFVGVLIFAFVVASVASLLLYRLLLNRPQSAKAAPTTAQIVLATRDIEMGTVLKEEDVKLSDWPGAVPLGAATKTQDIVGRGVIMPIFAKEPMIESRLAPKGAGGGLAAMIPPGMRAVPVRVNEVVGVAGFVVPGMRVDVLISGQPAQRRCRHGHAHANAAAESRGAFRGNGFQERPGRQAGAGAGYQSSGHAGAGRSC